MNPAPITLLILFTLIACTESTSNGESQQLGAQEYRVIERDEYQLFVPQSESRAVLVLFGGYTETAEDIQQEFEILKAAKKRGIAVLFSNFNQKLWLEEREFESLAKQLHDAFADHELPRDKLYIGGFSSGGNIALLISDYLVKNDSLKLNPEGVFSVDAPVDLSQLYFTSEANIEQDFNEVSVKESKWLIETLEARFGHPSDQSSGYEKHSVFDAKTKNTENLKHLRNTKIRLYSEPDSLWWKMHRKNDYQQMNAYALEQLHEQLTQQGFKNVEYITSNDLGYRANGERHPHSWSIVDTDDLIKWMLND